MCLPRARVNAKHYLFGGEKWIKVKIKKKVTLGITIEILISVLKALYRKCTTYQYVKSYVYADWLSSTGIWVGSEKKTGRGLLRVCVLRIKDFQKTVRMKPVTRANDA
jgi:hypothetical protein